jgi:hypothetical protein
MTEEIMPVLLQAGGASALVPACSLLITSSVFVFLALLIRLLPLNWNRPDLALQTLVLLVASCCDALPGVCHATSSSIRSFWPL